MISALVALAMPGLDARADYNAGVEAYVAGDYAAAIAEWQPLALEGDPASQHGLGLIYEGGRGLARDYRLAAEWYQAAADQNCAPAQFNLGRLYRLGAGVEPDMRKAIELWRLAAQQDMPQAQVFLGLAYQSGDGVEVDLSRAVVLFQRAAKLGDPMGQYALGLAYETGTGIEPDLESARFYYERAAESGVEQAIRRLTSLSFPPTPEDPPAPPTEGEVLEPVATQVNEEPTAADASVEAESSASSQPGPVYIQIAAYVDDELAEREWGQMMDRHHKLLGGLPHRITTVQRDDGNSVYRLQAGPLPASDEAQAICILLKQNDTDCFLVRD